MAQQRLPHPRPVLMAVPVVDLKLIVDNPVTPTQAGISIFVLIPA